MLPIQIVLVLLFIFAILKTAGSYRRGNIKIGELIFWLALWVAASLAVISPDSTTYLAHFLGVGRGADLVNYLALALLFYLVFRLIARVEKIDRNITKIVRNEALEEVEKK